MLTYSDRVPPAARKRIDYAVEMFDQAMRTGQPAPEYSMVILGDPEHTRDEITAFNEELRRQTARARERNTAVSDAAVVEGLPVLLDTVVQILCAVARRAMWSEADLMTDLEGLAEQIIVDTYREHHSKTQIALEPFIDRMFEALRARPSWAHYITTLGELEAAETPPPTIIAKAPVRSSDGGKLRSVQETAEELGCSPDTIYRLIDDGELACCIVRSRKKIKQGDIDRIRTTPEWQWRHPAKLSRRK